MIINVILTSTKCINIQQFTNQKKIIITIMNLSKNTSQLWSTPNIPNEAQEKLLSKKLCSLRSCALTPRCNQTEFYKLHLILENFKENEKKRRKARGKNEKNNNKFKLNKLFLNSTSNSFDLFFYFLYKN